VFAIPGSIHAALAKGCHVLIREGAKLVDTAQDVLEALAPSPLLGTRTVFPPASDISLTDMYNDNSPAAGFGTPADAALLDALGHDPVHADALQARLGCLPGELSARLLVLELAGRVERLPGGLVQRVFKR
jgi:DNA processing protein